MNKFKMIVLGMLLAVLSGCQESVDTYITYRPAKDSVEIKVTSQAYKIEEAAEQIDGGLEQLIATIEANLPEQAKLEITEKGSAFYTPEHDQYKYQIIFEFESLSEFQTVFGNDAVLLDEDYNLIDFSPQLTDYLEQLIDSILGDLQFKSGTTFTSVQLQFENPLFKINTMGNNTPINLDLPDSSEITDKQIFVNYERGLFKLNRVSTDVEFVIDGDSTDDTITALTDLGHTVTKDGDVYLVSASYSVEESEISGFDVLTNKLGEMFALNGEWVIPYAYSEITCSNSIIPRIFNVNSCKIVKNENGNIIDSGLYRPDIESTNTYNDFAVTYRVEGEEVTIGKSTLWNILNIGQYILLAALIFGVIKLMKQRSNAEIDNWWKKTTN